MDTVLAAMRTAIQSYRAELDTVAAEEDNVRSYLDTLHNRRNSLIKKITDLDEEIERRLGGDNAGSADSG